MCGDNYSRPEKKVRNLVVIHSPVADAKIFSSGSGLTQLSLKHRIHGGLIQPESHPIPARAATSKLTVVVEVVDK